MLQTAMTKRVGDSRFIEFASLNDESVSRTQIEFRDGLIFMRTKKRTYIFT